MAKSTKAATPKAERKPKVEAAPAPAKPAKPKKKGGRSKYDPAMCERIVVLGKQGKTKSQMAAALEVARSTFDAWMDAHEEFREAWLYADTCARAYFEEVGERGILLGHHFNDRAYLAILRSRWTDFRESKEVELSGSVSADPVRLVVSNVEAGL